MKIKCPCGTVSREIKKTNSVGDIVGKTGFVSVLTHVGIIIYLCPKCDKKAGRLAKELLAVVRNEHLYFSSLVKSGQIKKGE